jgi:hypothetical protein
MKKIFLPVLGIFAGIGILTGVAQFSSQRRSESTLVMADTPRFDARTIPLEANVEVRQSFLVEPGFGTFVNLTSKSQIQIRIFKPDGGEIEPSSAAVTITKSNMQGNFIQEIDFQKVLTSGLWEIEFSTTDPTEIYVSTGNSTPGGDSVSVNVSEHTPEQGEDSLIYVDKKAFDPNTTKLEVEVLKPGTQSGIQIEVNDRGISPDKTANDGRFTGKAPTTETGGFTVSAFVSRKNVLGAFTRTQTETATYFVYEKTARIIDNPIVRLIEHPAYGVPESIELEFDLEVFRAKRYGVSASIGGSQPGKEAGAITFTKFESEDSSIRPLYNVGIHRIKFRGALSQWVDLAPGSEIGYHLFDDDNGRVIEKFVSNVKLGFPREQLFPKRFQSYDGDRLVDTNGDGDPDAMEVKFSANVYKAGNYSWSAYIELSKDAQVASSDRGGSAQGYGSGPLGLGNHRFTVNIALDDFWRTRAKGTFKITPVFLIPGGTNTVELPEEPEDVFKSNYYDLTLGQAEPPKTVASLIQIIRDAKTLRPADGIKAEMIAKLEEAEGFAQAGNNVKAYDSMVNDFGDLMKRTEGLFPSRTRQVINSTWSPIYDQYEARVQ